MKARLVTAFVMGLMAVDARISHAAAGETSEPDVVVAVSACPVVAPGTVSGAAETMVRVYRAIGVNVRVVEAGADPCTSTSSGVDGS